MFSKFLNIASTCHSNEIYSINPIVRVFKTLKPYPMKILKTITLGLLLSFCMHHATAQISKEGNSQYELAKPKLFKSSPERINIRLNEFDHIFNYEVGKTVVLPFASDFSLSGTVVSKAEDANANVKSIVIRSSDKVGATLTLSRIINEDNTIAYRGRILSFKHADAYDIVSESGTYYLVKKNASDIYEE